MAALMATSAGRSGRYMARERRRREVGICLFKWRSNHYRKGMGG